MNVTKTNLLYEGKTKRVWQTNIPGFGVFESKDDITALDGKQRDVISGKAALANEVNANCMSLLNACGIPTAFVEKIDEESCGVRLCQMIEYEVIIRREAYGSFLKGYPHIKKYQYFPKLIVQFNLKTTGQKWKDIDLPEDDPLVVFKNGQALLYRKSIPFANQEPFLVLDDYPLKRQPEMIDEIIELATKSFLVFEKAWQLVPGNYRLIDLKLEFGFDNGLKVADVVDPDSGRVIDRYGNHLGKQLYRDGERLDTVIGKYQIFAELTRSFYVPDQSIILWVNTSVPGGFVKRLEKSFSKYDKNLIWEVEQSAINQPIKSCSDITKLIQKHPDSVVLVVEDHYAINPGYIMASQISVPIVMISDVASSMPPMLLYDDVIKVPIKILAMRNPMLYMKFRYEQEKALDNYLII